MKGSGHQTTRRVRRFAGIAGRICVFLLLLYHVVPDGLCVGISLVVSFWATATIWIPRNWICSVLKTFTMSFWRRNSCASRAFGKVFCFLGLYWLAGFALLYPELIWYLSSSIGRNNPLGALAIPLMLFYGWMSFFPFALALELIIVGKLILGGQKTPFIRKFSRLAFFSPLLFPFGPFLCRTMLHWLKQSETMDNPPCK